MERVKFRAKSEQIGTVASVFVSTGDEVLKDDKLFSILMGDSELIVKSHTSGTIQDVYVTEEEPITDKGLLCDILTTEETLNMDDEPIFKTSEAIISEQEEPKFSLKHTDLNEENSDEETLEENQDVNLFDGEQKQLKDVIEQIDDDAFVSELLRKKTKASIKSNDHNRDVVDSLDAINEKITSLGSGDDSLELSRIFLRLRSDLLAIINSWQNVYDNFDEYSKQNDNKFKQVEDRISSNNRRILGEQNKLKLEFEKNLSEHISNSDSHVKNLKDRINGINSNLSRINNSISEIINKSEDDILSQAKYDDTQILSKIKTLTDSINSITTKYDYLETLLGNSNSYDDQKIIERIKTISESVTSLRTKVELMSDDNSLTNLEQKLDSSISTNKIFREKIESKLSKLEESVDLNSTNSFSTNSDLDYSKFVTKDFLDKKLDSSIRELKLSSSSSSLELDTDDFVTKEKLNSKLNALREDFDEKVKDYKKVSYSGNEFDISKYTTKIYLEDKLDDLRHDIKVASNHSRKIESLEDKIEKVDRVETKIEKLESKIDNIPSIDKIESKLEKVEIKLDKMPKDNSDKIEKLESKLEKYKDAIKSNKTEISELKKIIKKLLNEKETAIKTVVPAISTQSIVEDVNVRVREYTRLYDLNDIFTYYNEMNFNLKSIESNVRIDFIIYKAITNALYEKNFLAYDDITIGKITSNVMRFKKLVIADKTLEFMYENQNSIAKKTDQMGTVVVIDSKIEDKVLKLFKSSPNAKLLIVFMGSRKTDDSNKSILLKYYIKTSVNEENMIKFLDDLDVIIPNPEQMK